MGKSWSPFSGGGGCSFYIKDKKFLILGSLKNLIVKGGGAKFTKSQYIGIIV